MQEVAKMRELMAVALGEEEADLAIVNAQVVNVYTREVLKGSSILVKGERIAYVGPNPPRAIGSKTRVIDAQGKVVIPGFIDGHTHIFSICSLEEVVRYAILGGTTTIITELAEVANPLGYGVLGELIKVSRGQAIKLFFTLPPMGSISQTLKKHAITARELRRLLKEREVIGLGESYWAQVIGGDERQLKLISEVKKMGGKVEGHSSGARGSKLQAYISTGISSCHEPIESSEVLERLRLGLYVLVREGEVRRELEAISKIKDEKVSFRRLVLSTDGLSPKEYIRDGYMDFVVQKAIGLGWEPLLAIQMATLNVAQHFCLDDFLGGIAPGKYADMLIIPDLETIKPEYVISNGRVVAQGGRLLEQIRKPDYPEALKASIKLPRDFTSEDFLLPVANGRSVKVRVIRQVTDLLTQEEVIELPLEDGKLMVDTARDIVKVAAIERTYLPGKTFVGLIKGLGLKSGAIATSTSWDCSAIIVVGANEADMAGAVNRVKRLGGGIVVYAKSRVLSELALPLGGIFSTEPMEVLERKMAQLQEAGSSLGCRSSDIRLTISVLSTSAIPYLRICEDGLFNIRENRLVSFIVG